MEGQAERLVSFVAALVVEQVVLQVLLDGEQRATSRVRSRVDAVGAESTLDDRGYDFGEQDSLVMGETHNVP